MSAPLNTKLECKRRFVLKRYLELDTDFFYLLHIKRYPLIITKNLRYFPKRYIFLYGTNASSLFMQISPKILETTFKRKREGKNE